MQYFLLIIFCIGWRLLKIAPNFAPISALALYSGSKYSNKKSFLLVMLTMIISDFFIGFYKLELMISVYGSFLIIALLGKFLSTDFRYSFPTLHCPPKKNDNAENSRSEFSALSFLKQDSEASEVNTENSSRKSQKNKIKKFSFNKVLGFSLLSSVIFFIITNFAVWLFSSWYPRTKEGLFLCFFLALPFFKNTLLSDLFFVPIFFYGYEMIRKLSESIKNKLLLTRKSLI